MVNAFHFLLTTNVFSSFCIAGPKLVGPYEPTIALLPKTAPVWFFTHLPASVENIRYFDELGNNSFSSIINRYSSKTIRFRLRHPLISGWKSSYALVYQVPTYEYLYKDSGHNYLLRMRALDHVLNDVFVKDVEVRVLLPEGAVVRKVQVPQLFQISDVGFKFNSSLGLFGRPMISFNGKMLSEKHICLFSVGYFVSGLYMWRGPLLVAVYFEAVFIGVIVFQRI